MLLETKDLTKIYRRGEKEVPRSGQSIHFCGERGAGGDYRPLWMRKEHPVPSDLRDHSA